ncbi:hypothetical protein BASA50_006289 [Batrachochytrium salamandrivorans]|uniref:Uncharacterized protein n=1 Tax=Batrachochytrium salamandrivorans TaxID=1357716 RepID=A0ABQ8FDL2_9FUNG|nr:hypothetical protein BASA50_006289 [Batrachochytrium salamandrivorans]
MKFNALVVAAMVITSVNAAGKGGLLGCFGLGCGSGSESSQDWSDDDSESKNPENTADDDLEPGFPEGIPWYKSDKTQDPDTIKEGGDNGSNALEVDVERLCCRLMVDLEQFI